MFEGLFTALITPHKNGHIDYDRVGKLIEMQYKAGVHGIVPCGSTGESSTMSHKEHQDLIEFCVKEARGKMKVLAGSGSNSTQEAIGLTQFAKDVGCDGALIVSPYYNKPTQEGLFLHYKKIADTVDIPIIVYNIAGRTSVNIEPETFARLSGACKNIVGVKEASGSLDQMSRIKFLTGKNFELISGDDALTLPLLAIGGIGVISVISNIAPAPCVELINAFNKGDMALAQKLHYELLPLIKALFIETNPIPIKTAASIMGLCELEFRLPLCEMSKEHRAVLEKELKKLNLI
jgi:4-hydroxy-tetrahydrodipicolinate synthase